MLILNLPVGSIALKLKSRATCLEFKPVGLSFGSNQFGESPESEVQTAAYDLLGA